MINEKLNKDMLDLIDTKEDKINDTGWETLTSTYTSDTFKIRKIGNIVNLVIITMNVNTTNEAIICTLPEKYRPSSTIVFMMGSLNNTYTRAIIDTDGVLKMNNTGGTSYAGWRSGSVSYFVD